MSNVLKAGLLKNDLKIKDSILVKLLESVMCSICHDLMFVPVMTQCGHNYCYDCLSSWFDSNSNELTCPQCRANISNPPSLNNVLQQWLNDIIELRRDSGNETDGEFRDLLAAKECSEKSYKFDEKSDILFGNVFKTSAMGVIDEDDDGILRCSNCHWELEDDVGDMCPHCNSRIRSRMGRSGNGGEQLDHDDEQDDDDDGDDDDDDDEEQDDDDDDDEDDDDDDEDDISSGDLGLEHEISKSVVHYRMQLRKIIDALHRNDSHYDKKLLTMGTTAAGVPFYFPTYAMYLSNDYSLSERDRSRRMQLAESIETQEEGKLDTALRKNDEGYHSNTPEYQHYTDDDFSEDTGMHSDSIGQRNAQSIIETESELDEGNDEESMVDSSHDSDYYERHGGGFVSGDSLDDRPVKEDPLIDEGQEDQEDEGKGSSRDNSYNRKEARHGRKRFHVLVDSEDE